jgi:hypothetical protein
VFLDGERVLGGGVITKALPPDATRSRTTPGAVGVLGENP